MATVQCTGISTQEIYCPIFRNTKKRGYKACLFSIQNLPCRRFDKTKVRQKYYYRFNESNMRVWLIFLANQILAKIMAFQIIDNWHVKLWKLPNHAHNMQGTLAIGCKLVVQIRRRRRWNSSCLTLLAALLLPFCSRFARVLRRGRATRRCRHGLSRRRARAARTHVATSRGSTGVH